MMNWFMVRRLSVLGVVLSLGYLLTQLVTPVSDLISIEDALLFFLGSVVFVLVWKPTVRFFTDHPIVYSRFLSLSISFFAAGFMLLAVSSLTLRATGRTILETDSEMRFGFRYLFICGAICACAAPEFFEQEITTRRLTKLGAGLACIILTVLVLVYGNRLATHVRHDMAPTFQGP